MEDKILTFKEVCEYLKIPKSTLYKLVEKGQVPSSKVGKQLRFRKSSLDKWLTEKENASRTRLQEDLSINKSIDKIETPQPTSKQVLLIDDDILVLKTLSKFLNLYGYQVELAQTGEEALEKIGKTIFDLVIADVRMPGIDGLETIRRTRRFYDQSNRLPAQEIIITGYIDAQAENQAESLGITDYLYKPFTTSDFINTVKKKLASQNAFS